MKFVEDTRETWTATQLEQVEQEIEKQKREWEANRLAEEAREEEERKRREAEDNVMLTFSREDAKNQVNNSSLYKNSLSNNNGKNSSGAKKKSKNNKLSKNRTTVNVGSNNYKKQQKVICKKSPQKSVQKSPFKTGTTSMTTKKASPKSGKKLVPVKRSPRKAATSTPNIPVRRRLMSKTPDDSKSGSDSSTASDSDDVPLRKFSSVGKGKVVQDSDRDDSECSLDVMIDSNDATADSDSNHTSTNQVSTQEEDPLALDGSDRGAPTRRTRSRGTVKINLWNLDESNVLPSPRASGRKKTKSDDTLDITQHSQQDNTENSTFLSNSTLDNSTSAPLVENNADNIPLKELKVILHRSRNTDTDSSTPEPNVKLPPNKSETKRSAPGSKSFKSKKRVKTGKVVNTLDKWICVTPKVGVSLEDQNICKRYSPQPVNKESGCHENGDIFSEENETVKVVSKK